MTANRVSTREPLSDDDAERPVSRSLPHLAQPARFTVAGIAVAVIGALLVGFVLQFAGLSQITQARDQQLALESLRFELANATAPVGQVGRDGKLLAEGTPVAILEIPSLDLHQVVLEGTASGTTLSGPGHRRDTPLPGQVGASVVYGRQSTYGAPFSAIASLSKGDRITATTGQGVAKYTVTNVRFTGDELPAAMKAGEGRLTLVSGAGLPFIPNTIVRVDAQLDTDLQESPGKVVGYAALNPSELTMEGEDSAWPLLVLGFILLFVTLALFTLSRRYWGRWQTWIVAIPVLLASGIFTAQQVATLLPNLI